MSDQQLPDPVVQHAFVSALSKHLELVETSLKSQSFPAGQTEEETIQFQDLANDLNQVRTASLSKICLYNDYLYWKKHPKYPQNATATMADYARSSPSGISVELAKNLLGPEQAAYDVPWKTETIDIISSIEGIGSETSRPNTTAPFEIGTSANGSSANTEPGIASNVSESPFISEISPSRTSQLKNKLYLILCQAVSTVKLADPHVGSLPDSQLLSYCASKFLSEAPVVTGIPFSSQMESKITVVQQFLEKDNSKGLAPRIIYTAFKGLLHYTINYVVTDSSATVSNTELTNKLREQGNNLMSNSAFAQAIKVYTNALDVARLSSHESIPQLLTNRAIAYIGLYCFIEAIEDLNRAVCFDRTFTPAWTQLGYCHLYMGSGLTALKCYLLALKCTAGEILPVDFPANNAELRTAYRASKIKAVLPQFVSRLCQSIALTEKRAYQSYESSAQIRQTASEVRKTLALLRAECSEEDRDYFAYFPNLRDSNLRNMADRANRARPNILSPEVAQNMMSSTGVETVQIPRETVEGRAVSNDAAQSAAVAAAAAAAAGAIPTVTPRRPMPQTLRTNASAVVNNATTSGATGASSGARPSANPAVNTVITTPDGRISTTNNFASAQFPPVRDFFNNFGAYMEDDNERSRPTQESPQTGDRAPSPSVRAYTMHTSGTPENMFRDVIQGLGTVISTFTQEQSPPASVLQHPSVSAAQRAARAAQSAAQAAHRVGQVLTRDRSGNTSGTPATRANQPSQSPTDEDIDMPDDLD
ncbi:hypothetical protein G9P44_005819 [Scheffersomyces stipitis]|nr:hypothetical protein G9P44_005819 [Scheffersomyces stipitis]